MFKNDEFLKTLKALMIPIALQNLMSSLVSVSDALMVGFINQESLSAISLATQIQFVFSLVVLGMSSGLAILLAQYWGKKDYKTMEEIIPYVLKTNILIGLLFSVLAILCPRVLMLIFTNELVLIENGIKYLRVVSISYLAQSISLIYLEVLRNTGKTKQASIISSSSMVINIVLNAIFIYGLSFIPTLGIKGAALATSLTRLIELIWAYIKKNEDKTVRIFISFNKTKETIIKEFWKYGIHTMGAALVWGFAFSFHSVILGHLGNDAVAANSISSIVKQVLSCLVRGLGGATAIMVGNVLGSGDLQKGKEYGLRLTKLSFIFGLISGLLILITSPLVIKYANLSPISKGYLKGMLVYMSIYVVFQSMNHVILDGVFTAGGDAKFDMIGNIFAMWLCCIPLGLIAGFIFNLNPFLVFIIINLDEIVKFPAVVIHYKKYIWVRNITH